MNISVRPPHRAGGFRKAKRSGVKLMIGLAGPSGCGKTFSALSIAKGIQEVDGGEIFVIDSENRRSEHYADDFDYQIGELHEPFNPYSYRDKVEEAVSLGAKIIIVDSASHMHEGEGGVLDMHESELDRIAGQDEAKRHKNNMNAWRPVKKELNQTVLRLVQVDAHIIFCFRAQEKIKPINGKPTSQGIQPIASKELSYEMSVRLVLPGDGENKGVPDLRAPATKLPKPLIPMVLDGKQLSIGFGRMLATWAKGDSSEKIERQRDPSPLSIENFTDPDQAQPSSPDAPASEGPSESSQDGPSRLTLYHRELTGAQDRDELAARHEGSEHRGAFSEDEKPTARQILTLHTRRIKHDIGGAAFKAQIAELLEGVPA